MMLIFIDSRERIQLLLDELTNTLGKPIEEAKEWALILLTKGLRIPIIFNW